MDKKAQGMSVNVIIIVAIGLIVLVVLVALFTGRLGGFSKGVDASQSCNAVCGGIGGSFANEDKADCTGRFIGGTYSGDILGKGGCCCEGVGGGAALKSCDQTCEDSGKGDGDFVNTGQCAKTKPAGPFNPATPQGKECCCTS